MKENIKKAASLLRIDPHLLNAIIEHAREIDNQFKLNESSPSDNIYAVKIIVQDNDENWYVSQDEPIDNELWADARSDERDFDEVFDEDEWGESDDDSDDEGDGGVKTKPKSPVLT